jgi:cyanate permease
MDMPQIGAKYMGVASGIFFMLMAAGGFSGPLIVGFLADLTQSILPGMIAMALMVETMLIFTLLMKDK